jgi:large subunit ribosomal protein L22
MKTKYAFQEMKENMARAITKDLGISTKTSIEMSNFLRGKKTDEAKAILERVLKKTQAIPFKRFTDGVGHRKGAGITSGRFPQKASEAFITLIKQCEANAQAKGLSTDLRIVHLVAQKGTNAFRNGRQRRRQYKRTHMEIVLEEVEKTKPTGKTKEKTETKTAKPATEKVAEPKPATKKEETKEPKAEVKKEAKVETTVAEKPKEIKKEEKKAEVKEEKMNDSKKQATEEQK